MPDPSPFDLLGQHGKQTHGNISKIISLWLKLAVDSDRTIRRLTLAISFIAFAMLMLFLVLLIHVLAAMVNDTVANAFKPLYYGYGEMGLTGVGAILIFPAVMRFGERADANRLEAGMINVEQRRLGASDADDI